MNAVILLLLVWVHFIADFVMQSDKVAKGKSGSNKLLLLHVMIYSAFLVPFGLAFAAVNMALHFATDYVSSRATSKLWQAGERHWFFVVIGADQAVHMSCLFLTYPIWGNPLWV